MSRVSVNKDLLDNLADSISNKFDEDTPLTLAGMKGIVDDIPSRSSTDLSSSGATVTAPAGYYASSASKSVATGTEGTPTATKGTVSNHQVTITPSVTNTTGYITGSTKTGTAVTVTASELASGNKEITSNGTGIDVVGYSTVNVAVPSGGGNVFLVTLEFDDETGYWVPNQTITDIATAYGQGKTIVVNCDEDISFVSAEGKYWNNYGTFEYFVREEKNNSTVVVVQDYVLNYDDTVRLNWEEEYGEITDGNEMYFGDNPEITPYVGYGEVDSAVLR